MWFLESSQLVPLSRMQPEKRLRENPARTTWLLAARWLGSIDDAERAGLYDEGPVGMSCQETSETSVNPHGNENSLHANEGQVGAGLGQRLYDEIRRRKKATGGLYAVDPKTLTLAVARYVQVAHLEAHHGRESF